MNYNTKMFLEENYQSVLWIQLVSRRKKKRCVHWIHSSKIHTFGGMKLLENKC